MQTKYVFVTGGVVSGLGKGLTVASLGRLLKARGYRVITQKFDPYINVDPGNLNPLEHGEVFVTDDGAETDLDLGHYERFTDESLSENNSITMGKIYRAVLDRERANGYGGRTVQVIPHITDEIKERIRRSEKDNQADIVITEVGGTVGDIESLPILEAIRQIAHDVGWDNVSYVHISLVPHLDYIGEMKTKPTQHSVKELLTRGIQPDIIVCRSDREIPIEMRKKLALFCNVEQRCVVQNHHATCIYEVPLLLEEEKLADALCYKLKLTPIQPDLTEWRVLVDKYKNPKDAVTIGIVGSCDLQDAYLSVAEALRHAGLHQELELKVNIEWLLGELDNTKFKKLEKLNGIVLVGGIGEDCQDYKNKVVEYAKTNGIPFFGIGNGMQCALGATVVNDECRGAKKIRIQPGTKVYQAYGKEEIEERFRGSFNIPAEVLEGETSKDWIISEGGEVAELANHNWFVCVQFHPEYKSRLTKARPLFMDFIKAGYAHKNKG